MREGGGGEFIKTLDANSMSSLSVYLLKLRRIPAKNFEINETLIFPSNDEVSWSFVTYVYSPESSGHIARKK